MAQRTGLSAGDLTGIGRVLARRTHPVWIGKQRTARSNARRELAITSWTRGTPTHITNGLSYCKKNKSEICTQTVSLTM